MQQTHHLKDRSNLHQRRSMELNICEEKAEKAHVTSEPLCLATHCLAVAVAVVVDDDGGYFEDNDDNDDSCCILAI